MQRGELLFVYQSDNKAFLISQEQFVPITHKKFWEQLENRRSWKPTIPAPSISQTQNLKPTSEEPPRPVENRELAIQGVLPPSVTRPKHSITSPKIASKTQTLSTRSVWQANTGNGRKAFLYISTSLILLNVILVIFNVIKISSPDIVPASAVDIAQVSDPKLNDLFPIPLLQATVVNTSTVAPTETATNTALPSATQTSTHTQLPTMTPTQPTTTPTKRVFTLTATSSVNQNATLKVIASSVIVRPSVGNRTQTVTELKKGTTVKIIGFAIYKEEKTIWWRISSTDGNLTGWIVHNPKFIEVTGVQFDQDVPVNITNIRP
jgi:hypothetical protein